jgi:hypothetical protein
MMVMANLAALHYIGAGALVGVTCFTPEPGEPAACAAGSYAALSLAGGGTVLSYGAYQAAKNEVIPGIEEAFNCD